MPQLPVGQVVVLDVSVLVYAHSPPARRILAHSCACSLPPAPPDEWAELPEWVQHHLQVGVGKIYIMDDGSQASTFLPGRSWCTPHAFGWQCRRMLVQPKGLPRCTSGCFLLGPVLVGPLHHLTSLGSCQ